MQRAEHQVTSERRLNGNLGHFKISNFTDENNVGRLTQHGAQHTLERKADCFANLALIDARKVIFHRVFGGDDLAVGAVQNVQRAVQRCGLSGAGRPRHQKDAVGALDELAENLVIVFGEAEVFQTNSHAVRPQNTQHDRFAVVCRQSAHTKIDLHFVDDHLDAPVLREALFGDINPSHDLHSGDQRAFHFDRDFLANDAFAVDAIPQLHAVFHWLDVNVAGPVAHRFDNERINQFNDRCLRRVAPAGAVFAHAGQVDRFIDRPIHGLIQGFVHRLIHRGRQAIDGFVHRLIDGIFGCGVEQFINHALDAALGGQHRLDFFAHAEAQDVHHLHIAWVVCGNAQLAVFLAQRKDQILLHQLFRNARKLVRWNASFV